jgi:hypothetical protein
MELKYSHLSVLFLITAEFMRSHYCTNIELKRAFELLAKDGTRVIPIITEDCDWESMPIFSIAALPKDIANNIKHLNKWRGNQDSALKQIARHIRTSIEDSSKERPAGKKYPESQQMMAFNRKTARLGVTLGWQLARLEFFDDSLFEQARAAAPQVREDIEFLLQQDGTDRLFKVSDDAHRLINRILLYYDTNRVRGWRSLLCVRWYMARNQVRSGTLVEAKIVPAISEVCRRQDVHW